MSQDLFSDLKTMILIYVFCYFLKSARVEQHILQYLYTLRSAPDYDPEFEITTVFDGLIISHCESPTFRDQSRHDWIQQAFTVEEWKSRNQFCENEYYFHKTLKQNIELIINTTSGIIQRERSCTADDSSVFMSDRWGVNGEDFLTLDLNTLKWSSDSSLANTIQSEWNQMKFMSPSLKNFQQTQCKPSLMKLSEMKGDYLQPNPRPDVHIFSKLSREMDTAYLRCYISHKYLPGIRVRLTLDGMVVDKNINISSPAPNMDGTVQIRLQTKTSIKEAGRYHCAMDTDNLLIATEWDGQTLDKELLTDETGLHDFTKQPVIGICLCFFGTLWIICAVAVNICLVKKARRQRNITISKRPVFLNYVPNEEEWRAEAEADDEFYLPLGRSYRNLQTQATQTVEMTPVE